MKIRTMKKKGDECKTKKVEQMKWAICVWWSPLGDHRLVGLME